MVFIESDFERQFLRMAFHEQLINDPWTAKRIGSNMRARATKEGRNIVFGF